MMPKYKKGKTGRGFMDEMWTSNIDVTYNLHDSYRDDTWEGRIQVYGESKQDAIEVRDRVLKALVQLDIEEDNFRNAPSKYGD